MTTTYATFAKKGRLNAAESGAVFLPRVINGSARYPIIACHAANSTGALWFEESAFRNCHKLIARAAVNGIPAIAEDLGGLNPMGNATNTSRVAAALTSVASETGCSSSKAHLVGLSMGTATAVQYAIANPTKVASLTLMIPLVSIINTYKTNGYARVTEANGVNNLSQLIATAWGVAYRTVTDAVVNSGTPTTLTSATAAFTSGDNGKYLITKAANGIAAGATITFVNSTTVTLSQAATVFGSGKIVGFGAALPAGADIMANTAALVGIPTRIYYATDDQTIDPADVTAFAAAIGVTPVTTTGGHADAGMLPAGFDFDAWAAWLITNGG